MKKLLMLLFTLVFIVMMFQVDAQVYIDNRTQHRFAQSYIGFNTQIVPASGRLIWQNEEQLFPFQTVPRFTIGGLHFWGRLDFNINFPLARFSNKSILDTGEVDFNTGADLSARYYPLQLVDGKLRPFVGLSFNTMGVSLKNSIQGERAERFITSSVMAGLSFSQKGWQVNAELMFMPESGRDFYSSRQQKNRFELPNLYYSLGLIKYFDFTLENEKPKLSGATETLFEQFKAEGKLNSFSLGVAPNSTYFFKSPAFSGDLASLPNHKGSFNLEYSLGYLFHSYKLHLGLVYRNYSSTSLSYRLEHIMRREALSIDVLKFLLDYNGFVPFVGVSLSAERWAAGLFIDDVQEGETERSRFFSPGIVFGWDIVPSPLETWVLRTNLRYYPFQEINDINLKKTRVDQFEFNFIQFVFYPNRWNRFRKVKRNFYY